MTPHLIAQFSTERERTTAEGSQALKDALATYGALLAQRVVADSWLVVEELAFYMRRSSGPVRDAVYAILLDGAQLGVNEARAELGERSILPSNLAPAECATWADAYAYTVMNGLYAKTVQGIQDAIGQWQREVVGNEIVTYRPWPYLFSAERAHVIAITETTRAIAHSKFMMYRSAGVSSYVVHGATNGDCACAPFVDREIDMGSGILPPFHPRCSCRINLP